MKKKTLKIDLLKDLIFSSVFTISIVVIIIVILLVNFIKNEQASKNNSLSDAVSLEVEHHFNQIESSLLGLNEVLYVQKLVPKKLHESYYNEFIKNTGSFSSIYILNDKGIILETYPTIKQLVGLDYSNYDYYVNANEDNTVYWSNVHYEYYSKNPIAAVSLKTSDKVLVGILNLDKFVELVQGINIGGSCIAITDETGVYYAHTNMEYVYLKERDKYIVEMINQNDFSVRKIEYENQSTTLQAQLIEGSNWSVIVYQSLEEVNRQILYYILITIVASLISLIVAVYFNRNKIVYLADSLQGLVKGTQIISKGEYEYQLAETNYKEIEELRQNFIIMSEKIKKREMRIKENEEEILKMNEELEVQVYKRTQELENSVEDLKHAQKIIIQSEKLASLGQLVAGITHEMMTPIGSIVTISSMMEREINTLYSDLENNELKKSDLDNFLAEHKEAIAIILRNSERTKEFIESFKKTSVDQSSMKKRNFDVCLTIEDVIRSMKVQLKRSHVEVNINCTQSIVLHSYPGAITQIILNLVNNSIKHAFIDRESGNTEIDVKYENNTLMLKVSDDGIGMEPEVLDKIFEPFFTTARNRGGSGLGMNIVYNLVTNLLDGTIECESTKGVGTVFKLNFTVDNINND